MGKLRMASHLVMAAHECGDYGKRVMILNLAKEEIDAEIIICLKWMDQKERHERDAELDD